MLTRFDNLRIQQKLVSVIVLLLGLTALFIVVLFPWGMGIVLHEGLSEQTAIMASMSGHGAETGLIFENESSVQKSLEPFKAVELAHYAAIFDAGGRRFAGYVREGVQVDGGGIEKAVLGLGKLEPGQSIGLDLPGLSVAVSSIESDGATIGLSIVGFSTERLESQVAMVRKATMVFAAIGLATGLLIFFVVARRIVKPIQELDRVAQRVAAGEIDVDVHVRSGDEIGKLAATFAKMLENIRGSMNQMEQHQNDLNDSVEGLLGKMRLFANGDLTVSVSRDSDDAMGRLYEGFNLAVKQLRGLMEAVSADSETLNSAAEDLSRISSELLASSSESTERSSGMASTTRMVNENIQSVASATEEMSASIREIAQNSGDAVTVAGSAVRVADQAGVTIRKLGDSSAEIGEVVKVINAIAEQTNLLALNATIEAARAGEAGKGFAVVAGEVKELAKETAKATEEISTRISAIQTDTRSTVDAIGEINSIISRINDIQTTIAGAVEEQAVTTSEIGQNLATAAAGSGEIAENADQVVRTARSAMQGATDTQSAAGHLADVAGSLMEVVRRFKY